MESANNAERHGTLFTCYIPPECRCSSAFYVDTLNSGAGGQPSNCGTYAEGPKWISFACVPNKARSNRRRPTTLYLILE